MQPATTIHSDLQPPKKTPKTTHNHPKITPKSQNLSQLCYCTLDVNIETDIDFDSDMKQWCIYMYVCLCVHALYLLFFG